MILVGGAYAPVTTSPVNPTINSFGINNNHGKTAVESFQELEDMKHLISQTEYESKKQEIIASL